MELKVLSFNIHKGFGPLGRSFTLPQIKKYLDDIHPDIVFLQEVVGENKEYASKIHSWPQETQYEFLADKVWPHHAYAKNAVYEKRHHGNVILSKYPIIKTMQIDISQNSFEQRGVLFARIELPTGKNLDAYCVHLNLLNRDRLQQYKDINRIVDNYGKLNPIIIAGDFNDWNKKASWDLGKNNIHDAYKTLHGHYAKTFPALLPIAPLDRCYTNLSVKSAEVLRDLKSFRLSDHLPILLSLEVDSE